MLELMSESEAESDDRDPRVIKDDIKLAVVRPDRMQTDMCRVSANPNQAGVFFFNTGIAHPTVNYNPRLCIYTDYIKDIRPNRENMHSSTTTVACCQ